MKAMTVVYLLTVLLPLNGSPWPIHAVPDIQVAFETQELCLSYIEANFKEEDFKDKLECLRTEVLLENEPEEKGTDEEH